MSKRKYTHIKEIEPELLAMRKAGYTRQQIADKLGLEKEQIKSWINRYNRKQARLMAGLLPKLRRHPKKDGAPRDIVLEQEHEIDRLKGVERGWNCAKSQDNFAYYEEIQPAQ